jgi:hypothetical protein
MKRFTVVGTGFGGLTAVSTLRKLEPSAMRGGPVFEFLFGTDTLLTRQSRRDHFKLVFFLHWSKRLFEWWYLRQYL